MQVKVDVHKAQMVTAVKGKVCYRRMFVCLCVGRGGGMKYITVHKYINTTIYSMKIDER